MVLHAEDRATCDLTALSFGSYVIKIWKHYRTNK